MIKLSVLIMNVISRDVNNILNQIKHQLTDEVELIVLTDNKKSTISTKRNNLINMAQGKYIVFIDDDDIIESDYIKELLEGIKSGSDCVTFEVKIHLHGYEYMVFYAKHYKHEFKDNCYRRKPNWCMCIKRSLAKQVLYKQVREEDTVWANDIAPMIKSEFKINKVLYHQMTEPENSECGRLAKLPTQEIL